MPYPSDFSFYEGGTFCVFGAMDFIRCTIIIIIIATIINLGLFPCFQSTVQLINFLSMFQLPKHILNGLQKHSDRQIRMLNTAMNDLYRALFTVQKQIRLSEGEKQQLLIYMKDSNLKGLQLLPLDNGKIERFLVRKY